jgi:hypothetical protein
MMNLKGLFATLFLMASGLVIFYLSKNREGFGIPTHTFMMDSNHFIFTYFDHRNEKSTLVKHNFKSGETVKLAENTSFKLCFPLAYYNDTIVGVLNDSEPTKYCGYAVTPNSAFWMEDYPIKMHENYISYQKLMDKSDYDYTKLPTNILTAKTFTGAQYLTDNNGSIVQYKDMPVIVIYSNEKQIESKNIYSKSNWWKLNEFFSKKCLLGLYNEQKQEFEWINRIAIDGGAFYKMMLFHGVYQLEGDQVLLVDAHKTEILNLATGEIVFNTEIK